MSKRQFLCVLGVWVIIFLFLGIPNDYDKIIGVITGLVIVIVAYTLSGPVPPQTTKEAFIENKQP